MLILVSKLYGRMLIKGVRAVTECAIGEKQFGHWQARMCMDQLIDEMQVSTKKVSNIWKRCIWGFYGFGKGV